MEFKISPEQMKSIVNYAYKNMPKLAYHNFAHVASVAKRAKALARAEGIEDYSVVQAAAFLHDIVYYIGNKDNEEKSAIEANQLLKDIGVHAETITPILGMILATKLPTVPRTALERIICDADLDNLGRDDFLQKCELLRKEFGLRDVVSWYTSSLALLKGHQYYTQSARKDRTLGLERNIQQLTELVLDLPR